MLVSIQAVLLGMGGGEDTRILIEQDKMFLQNQPRSVWMVPLFKCIHHCFSVFWPGCHDTQRLLYFVTHSFCGSAQSPTSPIVLVPFPCAAPPLQWCPTLSYFLSSCASLHLTQGPLVKGSPLFIVSAVLCLTLLFPRAVKQD